MPNVKPAVVMTPIVVSAPMMRRRLTPHREAGGETPQAGAEEEVDADGGAHRGAAEDRVAEPVADVAHAAEVTYTPRSPHSAPPIVHTTSA